MIIIITVNNQNIVESKVYVKMKMDACGSHASHAKKKYAKKIQD